MTIADIARERSMSAEVRKIAYRQTKEGMVVSLLLHPNDAPSALVNAPLGTRYIMGLCELDDNEEPKEVMPDTGQSKHDKTPPDPVADIPGRANEPAETPKGRRKFSELPLSTQAVLACKRMAFRRFLFEKYGKDIRLIGTEDDDEIATGLAATMVRELCGVKSRSEFSTKGAASAWIGLYSEFQDWMSAKDFLDIE